VKWSKVQSETLSFKDKSKFVRFATIYKEVTWSVNRDL